MHFDAVAAVFQRVFLAQHLTRQLARLAHRHEAHAQFQRHGGTEDEATRFDADHRVQLLVAPTVGHRGDGTAEVLAMGEQRHDVLEEDAGLGEVGDVAQAGGPLRSDEGVGHVTLVV